MTATVAVFVKYPQPGRVKTRLAKDLGDDRAALLYARMVDSLIETTFSKLPPLGFVVEFLCDPFCSLQAYQDRFPFPARFQVGADLGERLSHAFQTLLTHSNIVLAVGTDCIDLRPSHLLEAKRRLEAGADVVCGPAHDGGYYLIGCRAFVPALFENIPWSTDEVLSTTVNRAQKLHLRIEMLERLRDLDTIEDLQGTAFLS